jgi:mono/diheme cytochrome c family protein
VSLTGAVLAAVLVPQNAIADPAIERGEYLAQIMLCADCHSPYTEEGGPDLTRALSGGLGFEVAGLGIFWAPNLTPAESGLAAWSEEDIVTAIRTGVRPDGRGLAPIMPTAFFAALTDADAHAIARYLKSVQPIENKVPDPVGPGGHAEAPYLTMVAPPKPKP